MKIPATLEVTKSKDDETGKRLYLSFKQVETEFTNNIGETVSTLVLESVQEDDMGMPKPLSQKEQIAAWLRANPGFHRIEDLCSDYSGFGFKYKANMKRAVNILIEVEGNGITQDGNRVGAVTVQDSSTLIPMSPKGDILDG